MANALAIVFWRLPGCPDSAITIHTVADEHSNPDLQVLCRGAGLSIPDFFAHHGVSIEQAMEAFPGCIVPGGSIDLNDGKLGWNTPCGKISLPMYTAILGPLLDFTGLLTVIVLITSEESDVPRDVGRLCRNPRLHADV